LLHWVRNLLNERWWMTMTDIKTEIPSLHPFSTS
jgi:hypothetical protein